MDPIHIVVYLHVLIFSVHGSYSENLPQENSNNSELIEENYKWNPQGIPQQIIEGLLSKKPIPSFNPNSDQETHPCFRPCLKDPQSRMTCTYKFRLEQSQVMSPLCGLCPKIRQDCFNPGCIPADGNQRTIDTVNQMFPGPSIRVCEGDTIVVELQNELDEATSIHWHGIHQKKTPFMDGVPFVTNCPIPRHGKFRYEFDTPIGGMYFWHSHFEFQRGDGIVGALVVRKPLVEEVYGPKGTLDLYDFDLPQHEFLIMDWQKEESKNLSKRPSINAIEFYPNNILINGKGMQKNFFKENRPPNEMMPLHEVFVERNMSYRFRLIMNGIKPCPLEMSIENHTMQIIGSDGKDLIPITVDSLVLYSGERWDVVIHADQPIGSYWIKFRGFDSCNENNANLYQVAVLNYAGMPPGSLPNHFIKTYQEALPPTGGKQLNPYDFGTKNSQKYVTVANLYSVHDDDPEIISKEKPDHKFYLPIDYNYVKPGEHIAGPVINFNGSQFTPQINSISNLKSKSPLLSQPEEIPKMKLCNNLNKKFKINNGSASINTNGGKDCTKTYCGCTHLLKVKFNSIVEIILIDKGVSRGALQSNHPFHLHGHWFRIMGMEKLYTKFMVQTVRKMDKEGLLMRRRSYAPIKDSVTVPYGGYTIIRFRADNRGFWFFHCHIEYHLIMGMSLTIQVGDISRMPKRPAHFPKCGTRSKVRASSSN